LGNILFAKLITAISTKHLYAAYTNSSEIGLNKSWEPGHLGSYNFGKKFELLSYFLFENTLQRSTLLLNSFSPPTNSLTIKISLAQYEKAWKER